MGCPQLGFDRDDAALAGWDASWWDIRMDAALPCVCVTSGRLVVPKRMAVNVWCSGRAEGGLMIPKLLAAEAWGQASAGGALCVPKTLQSTAQSQAGADGALAVPKRLAARVESGSFAHGGLAVPKLLAGTAHMADAVSAELRDFVWPEGMDGYARLITSQHIVRPRFESLLKTLTTPLVDIQRCLREMAEAFDVDTAVGVQLDQVGLWVGVSRVLRMALDCVYFSFDIAGVGFDEGIWRGQFDPDVTLTSLPDDQYRTLIRARIAANHWDGTIPSAYAIWRGLFHGSHVIIQDWQNMSITVGIAGLPLNAALRALLTGGYIPLKPQGVRVDYYAIGEQAGPLLGFDTDSPALAGWDQGQWPVELQPQHTGVRYASQ